MNNNKEMVNSPNHYNQSSIECIDAMEAAFGKEAVINFCTLNAFKYIWRCDAKFNKIEDLKKANWYINKTINLLEQKED